MSPVKKRYLFLDMLRAIAVAEMIHGHSLDGLLDVTLRDTPFFINWIHVRGYTAPIFLFAAGLALAITTLPHIDGYSQFSNTLRRRVKRLFFIILLGYLMYLPYFSLRKTILSIGSPAWHSFLRVDILRCIGVSGLIMQLWLLLKPKQALTWVFVGAITIALPVLTPAIRESSFISSLPDFLRYYFVDSRFPLFYYASYPLLGFLIGYVFVKQKHVWPKFSLIVALLLVVIAQIMNKVGVISTLQGFMTKGGVIILLTVILERCEHLWQRLPAPVEYFGQESLVVYIAHVVVIYGSVLNKGVTFYWGAILSYGEVYSFVAWLFAAMVLLAYIWHKLKLEHPRVARWVKNTMFWSFLIIFLLRPY